MTFGTAYSFVPLSDFVFFPERSEDVSHDLPFKKGVSGSFRIRIVAKTDLMVGAKRTPNGDGSGDVKFFRLPDDRLAIPDTALKGMIRAVVSAASFGKMQAVDDRRLGIRDLTRGAAHIYRRRIVRPQAGWLRFDSGEGSWKIDCCRYAHVHHDELSDHGSSGIDWTEAASARERYEAWKRAGYTLDQTMQVEKQTARPFRRLAAFSGDGVKGYLVFTGKPVRGSGRGRKNHEFFFYHDRSATASQTLVVPSEVLAGFRAVHAESEEWNHWIEQAGGREDKMAVPVFFITGDDGKVRAFGLASMFRLPYEYSIHDMIRNTSADHLSHRPDLADLLFGYLGKEPDDALRARVAFGTAPLVTDHRPGPSPVELVLQSPRPSYYPAYVRQPSKPGKRDELDGDKYASYTSPVPSTDSALVDKPRLRGRKRYPVRDCATPPNTGPVTSEVATRMYPLPEGAVFEGRVHFHNLRPFELGALVWALEWGGDGKLRHNLGLAKAYGYGSVAIEIVPESWEVIPNLHGAAEIDKPTAMKTYVETMERVMKEEKRGGWRRSSQMTQLCAMANPSVADGPYWRNRLRSMTLDPKRRINEFADAKRGKWVLPDYEP